MTDGRLIASQAAGMALALGVGVLIGARACGAAAPAPEPRVETIVDERIVYECPPSEMAGTPDAGLAEVGSTPTNPERPVDEPSSEESLPDAPPPPTPAERQRLFDWVSQQSRSLTACAGGTSETLRTTVTLHLDDDGNVSNVSIVDPSADIDATTERCLRRHMKEWVPPKEFVRKRDRLIFGLVI